MTLHSSHSKLVLLVKITDDENDLPEIDNYSFISYSGFIHIAKENSKDLINRYVFVSVIGQFEDILEEIKTEAMSEYDMGAIHYVISYHSEETAKFLDMNTQHNFKFKKDQTNLFYFLDNPFNSKVFLNLKTI